MFFYIEYVVVSVKVVGWWWKEEMQLVKLSWLDSVRGVPCMALTLLVAWQEGHAACIVAGYVYIFW